MFDSFNTTEKCYDYFVEENIKTRDELRRKFKTNPIKGVNQSLAESLFSKFKQEQNKFKVTTRSKNQCKICKTVCISDMHIPFQDDKTVKLVFDFIVDMQPDNLVLLGDIIDCYWISKFQKKAKNKCYLQDEADLFFKTFSTLRNHIPNTKIFYVLGNHEQRLQKLKDSEHGLSNLRALHPIDLLKLDKLNISYHEKKVEIDGMLYFHGKKAMSKSGYSARAEHEVHLSADGISGHTHRLGCYYQTYDSRVSNWIENGCLCSLNPEYISGDVVNWQQGFSVVKSYDKINEVEMKVIKNHKFTYGDTIYK